MCSCCSTLSLRQPSTSTPTCGDSALRRWLVRVTTTLSLESESRTPPVPKYTAATFTTCIRLPTTHIDQDCWKRTNNTTLAPQQSPRHLHSRDPDRDWDASFVSTPGPRLDRSCGQLARAAPSYQASKPSRPWRQHPRKAPARPARATADRPVDTAHPCPP